MTWWTYARYRTHLVVTIAVLLVASLWLWRSGWLMADEYRDLGIARCLARGSTCSTVTQQFLGRHTGYRFLIPLFLVVPAVIGAFWGAPLFGREFESGTHRLAWTQSVTRRRWLGISLVTIAAAVLVITTLLTWLVSWWSAPLVSANHDRMTPGIFDLRGVVPIGYTAYALSVAVAAGLLLRRTVPAMAATLGLFVGVRLLVTLILRPRFATPVTKSAPFGGVDTQKFGADWVLSSQTADQDGHVLGYGDSIDLSGARPLCGRFLAQGESFSEGMAACIRALDLRTIASVHPADRYWAFQFIELGIYVGLAAVTIGLTFWWFQKHAG